MKLIDAIKEKGNPFEIPDCSRDELPEFFKDMGFKVGAEIGVFEGKNLIKYCQQGLKMYGIDPWKGYGDKQYTPDSKGKKYVFRSLEYIYRHAVENVKPYPDCTLIRKKSIDALKDIPDCSLDFVYIDGDHRFDQTAIDLVQWTYKVRKGGVIAGHDYYDVTGYRGTRQVGPVVDAFAKSFDMSNWYILGRVDGGMSFMFFKHWNR